MRFFLCVRHNSLMSKGLLAFLEQNTYSKEKDRYAEQATGKMLVISFEGCYNQKSVQEVTLDRVRYRRC